MNWRIVFTKKAQKDALKLKTAKLKPKAQLLLDLLGNDPFTIPPPYEKLLGDLAGSYSRRINLQHRIVYQIFEDERTVKVVRMWTHYQ